VFIEPKECMPLFENSVNLSSSGSHLKWHDQRGHRQK